MSVANKTLKLVPIFTRQFSRTSANNADVALPRIKKLRDNQKKFQVDDGLPIHLKGGIMDKVLYQITMGACLVSLGCMSCLFYELSVPKKQ